MPRDTDTRFVLKKGQFQTKKRGTAVDRVSTHGLMIYERGYIILDNPIAVQEGIRARVELVINLHRNSSIREFDLRRVSRNLGNSCKSTHKPTVTTRPKLPCNVWV